MKPSYLLGPEPRPKPTATPSPSPSPTPTTQSALKYPADMIDRFQFKFSYRFIPQQPVQKISQLISANASAINADKKPLTFALLPDTTIVGDSALVEFPLVMDKDLSGTDITVDIYVYPTIQTAEGPLFESFNQQLIFKKEGSVLTLKREDLEKKQSGYLGALSYRQEGQVDFSVLFKKDSALGAIEVSPPAVPPPPPITPAPTPEPLPLKELGPGDVIYTKLLNNIDASFQYQLKGAEAINNLDEEVTLSAVIEGTKAWTKTLLLVPPTHENGAFTIKFPIDLARYGVLIESIRNETGVSAESYQLTIRADVHVTGETAFGRLDEVFSPTLTTRLDKNMLEWAEKMSQSKPGSIETTQTLTNTSRYLGFSIAELKVLSLALTVTFLLCSLVLLVWDIRHKPPQIPPLEKERLKLLKKYGQRIAEVTSNPQADSKNIIKLNTIEDLVKIADELGKPVLYQPSGTAGGPHTYQVYDGGAIYQYVLGAGTKEPEDEIE